MTDAADPHTNPLGDWVEARVELAAEMSKVADWLHNYDATLEAVGIEATSLSVTEELALRHIATCRADIVHGIQELLYAARDVGFEEAASMADDDEVDDLAADDGYPPL